MTEYDFRSFYIDGSWVAPAAPNDFPVINPATEEQVGTISLGTAVDVDRAVAAARRAFATFSATSRAQRIELIERIVEVFQSRSEEIATAITDEMGAPEKFSKRSQTPVGVAHLKTAAALLADYDFEQHRGTTCIVREPIGVCGFITPWNWPINQIACKVAPALAAGCTMVLKPSELAPLSGYLFGKVLDEAGVPAGVFNLVNGDGPTVGAAIAGHPDVDLVSFTGSTRAGVEVAKAAAPSIKRVAQELGGKSANVLLASVDFEKAVTAGVLNCMSNSGQSCNAPTRMLVPANRQDEVISMARAAAESVHVGDPHAKETVIGPVISETQWNKIQGLIQTGIEEGATLVTGGTGRPEGLETGYYVQPTVFANVSNEMSIARQEIFGPVLCILPYRDLEDAVRIANDSPYGLSGYVQAESVDEARQVARRLRTGMVLLNGAAHDLGAPFGGYKHSGNGREWGRHGFEEFLEVKAIMGYGAAG